METRGNSNNALDYLYRSLDALDSKSSSVFQFSAILIFFISFLAEKKIAVPYTLFEKSETYGLGVALIFSVIALFHFLSVEWVRFFPRYHAFPAEGNESFLEREAHRILKMRTSRIIRFRFGWWACFCSMTACMAHVFFAPVVAG